MEEIEITIKPIPLCPYCNKSKFDYKSTRYQPVGENAFKVNIYLFHPACVKYRDRRNKLMERKQTIEEQLLNLEYIFFERNNA